MLLSSVDFFPINFLKKNSFRNTMRVSNGLDPDQDRGHVGPDLGPNCFAKVISRWKKSPLARKKLIIFFLLIKLLVMPLSEFQTISGSSIYFYRLNIHNQKTIQACIMTTFNMLKSIKN